MKAGQERCTRASDWVHGVPRIHLLPLPEEQGVGWSERQERPPVHEESGGEGLGRGGCSKPKS